jgi:hypothetical protein
MLLRFLYKFDAVRVCVGRQGCVVEFCNYVDCLSWMLE